jgi:hypothetical protein
MYTIIETASFTQAAKAIWSEEDRAEFCIYIANHPLAGDVIPQSGGCRKVRYGLAGIGKRGGARVIYYNQLADGNIYLLVIYTKSVRGNIPAHLLKAIKESLDG